jgi:hypothetical protein
MRRNWRWTGRGLAAMAWLPPGIIIRIDIDYNYINNGLALLPRK